MPAGNELLLIGIHPVAAALRAKPQRVRQVVLAQEARNPRVAELGTLARQHGIAVRQEPRQSLDRRSGGERHQDVLAELEAGPAWGEHDLAGLLARIDGPPLLLALDGVQDPHNLGACLRTAEAAGVHFVILPRDRAAGLSPVTRRAASGAAEVLDIVTVTNLARVLRQLREAGVWLVGAADEASQSLYDTDLRVPLALVVGGEGKGMRRLTTEACDYLVRIPMRGTVSSLNVSVATAVCLYEVLRQRSAA